MFESLTPHISVCVSPTHTFGSDALILSRFVKDQLPKAEKICDLGTGCGIIPLSLASLGVGKSITGIDIQEDAIDQFRRGISASRLSIPITPIVGDLREKSVLPPDTFDLAMSNPPYFQVGHGPLPPAHHRALARYEVACDARGLCATARRITKAGGRLALCYPPERLSHALRAMEEEGFRPKVLQFVHNHFGQAPWLFLLLGQKGAKDGLTLLPPMLWGDQPTEKEVYFQ